MNRRQFLQRLMMTPAILPFIPKMLRQEEPEVKPPKIERQPLRFSASGVMSGSAICYTTLWSSPYTIIDDDYEVKEDTHTDLYYSGHGDTLKDRVKFRTEWLKVNKPNLPS